MHEGRLYLAAMDLNQLNANVTKAAGSEVAKGLKLSKEDIMNDINAVAELHAKNKSTDEYFKKVADKKGYPERWRSRKNFINATQGLMTEGQLAGNPMFHALGQTKKSGIYRTFAFDLLDDAVRMNGESVTGYGPNNYYNLKQNLMPQMPNVNRNGDIISDTAGKTKFMPESGKKQPSKVRKSTFKGSPKQSPSNKDIAKSISYLISGALSRQMEREHEKTNGRRPQ